MTFNKTLIGLLCLLFSHGIMFGASIDASEVEKGEYKQDLSKIKAKRESLSPKFDKEQFQKDPEGCVKQLNSSRKKNDLDSYKKFADDILNKWKLKNKEYYSKLVLQACAPLSSGRFNENRRYEVARSYALSALEKPQEISLDTELELTGHALTLMIGPDAPKEQDWQTRRKKDVEIRMHAWRRLLDSIDPDWNPNEVLLSPNAIAAELGFSGTIEADSIKDPVLRQKYIAAIAANRQKIEKYSEQNKLRKWLKRYPKTAEEYIVQAYSKAPYNNEELAKYLDDYKLDEKTKARIIDSVEKNIEEEDKKSKKASK